MWNAVLDRTARPDPYFVYAVKTTGVYCRPDCPSRRPARRNVEFFPDHAAAEACGYRACMRCQPNGQSPRQANAERIEQACRLIQTAAEAPRLADLAAAVGMSPFHFQRVFKAHTGVSPKSYAQAHRLQALRNRIDEGEGTITSAIYAAGFGSSSRFYEQATRSLGMSASARRKGGKGVRILFAIGQCSLGAVLVASSAKGVCALLLGETPDAVLSDLQSRFPDADLVGDDEAYQTLIGTVIAFVDEPARGLELPLDIRGTAFQRRVWEVLQQVPAGETTTYQEVATRVGAPAAVRAVAQACGANNLAIAIPCHRVVRKDGALSGYRWGVERKRALLQKEEAIEKERA
ncbi:MAG: bifunctional DNA-binding transcriptional regulator/O6-methylguanine-DNA methyltransferase Ada [Neomegalonema sp.]|nr:bifunctional DNA-binding transcriptional regulator/O6-methylguanine-DNA methyltransferase Ada [Neomegalonema sp.]